jgi:4-amino-4-deoxy-L-arabinose transferase-like glycosyltransferase
MTTTNTEVVASPVDSNVTPPPPASATEGRARTRVAAAASNRAVQAVIVGVVALGLCLVRLSSSYDIFIDEVTYTRLARNLADGRGLTLDGQPFDLHPPALIGLLGAVEKVFGLHGTLERQVLDLRPVSAVFGALACAGAYLLVERAAGKRYALFAAALLAISPFVILYNSEVMLEAAALAAGVALFGFLAAATAATTDSGRRRCIAAAGLFGAVVVCTKETFGRVAVAAV